MRHCLLSDKIRKRKESMKKTQREKVRETRSLFDLNDKNKDSILLEQMKKMKRQGTRNITRIKKKIGEIISLSFPV